MDARCNTEQTKDRTDVEDSRKCLIRRQSHSARTRPCHHPAIIQTRRRSFPLFSIHVPRHPEAQSAGVLLLACGLSRYIWSVNISILHISIVLTVARVLLVHHHLCFTRLHRPHCSRNSALPWTNPPMARIKKTRQRQRSQCPVCFHFFHNVLQHLNHRRSRCSAQFEATPSSSYTPVYHTPEPPEDALPPDPSSPQPYHDRCLLLPIHPPSRVSFPGAGVTYGSAPTFLDRFNEDQYAPFRTANAYYPFSSEVEWELASFLLSSNLSMQKVNEFLKLKLVGCS